MRSLQQAEISAALDEVDAGYTRLRHACSDSVGNAYRVEIAERIERQHRTNRAAMYRIFGELFEPPDGPDDPDLPRGTVICKLLWRRLRITTAEVKTRMTTAARIQPRRCLLGPHLPPELPHLAAAVENGDLDERHIKAICDGIDALPSALHHKKDKTEQALVRNAQQHDPHFVAALARALIEELAPDTPFDEQDRRNASGLRIGRQRPDGMTHLSGWIDPNY